jgi:hypothetical protein
MDVSRHLEALDCFMLLTTACVAFAALDDLNVRVSPSTAGILMNEDELYPGSKCDMKVC